MGGNGTRDFLGIKEERQQIYKSIFHLFFNFAGYYKQKYCSLYYGWWLVLICCERKVLLTGWWLVLVWCERKIILASCRT